MCYDRVKVRLAKLVEANKFGSFCSLEKICDRKERFYRKLLLSGIRGDEYKPRG